MGTQCTQNCAELLVFQEIVPEGSVLEREHTVAPVVLARTHSVISAVRNQLEGDKVTPEERDVNRAETGTSAEEQQKNMPGAPFWV